MMFNEVYRIVKFICSIEFLRMSVLWTLTLAISHLRLVCQRVRGCNFSSFTRQPVATFSARKRPVCIITGATSGLGAAAAKALSKEGFFVILVGRSGERLSKTMAEIRNLDENVQLEAFEVDLSSFSSIMKLKISLTQWLLDMDLHPSIQLLINNAGILATSYRVTNDGLDEMMMTNYIGAFCLTKVLLPLLMNSPLPSRVVNVSSFTHRNGGCGVCFWAVIFKYQAMSQLSVNVADPGAVKTNIMREIPHCVSQLAYTVLKLLGLLQYPEKGVNSILDAALAPPETSGMYFFGGNGRTINSSPMSYNSILANRLWETSSNIYLELNHMFEKTTTLLSTSN